MVNSVNAFLKSRKIPLPWILTTILKIACSVEYVIETQIVCRRVWGIWGIWSFSCLYQKTEIYYVCCFIQALTISTLPFEVTATISEHIN